MELPVDCLRVIVTFRGRHEALRFVSRGWKSAFDSNRWRISVADVYNLISFRTIYGSCETIIQFLSNRKSDLVLLNKEKNVIIPWKMIAGNLFHDDNAIQTLRYRDKIATNDDFAMMPNLTSLELSSWRITDDVFQKMPLLRELKFTNVENIGVKAFPPLRTLDLQVFDLRRCPEIQPGLENLSVRYYHYHMDAMTYFDSLVTLDVRGCTLFCKDSEFKHLRLLEKLYMDNAKYLTENALVHIPGLEILHTKSGKVACSAVGNVKELVIRNIEFCETFRPSAKLKAASVEKIMFHRLDVPANLFAATKVQLLYMVCCRGDKSSLRDVGELRHCKGMRLGGAFSDYECECSRHLNFP